MYTVHQVEVSPLIRREHKAVASMFSFVIGPLLFFVLVVADVASKLEEGKINLNELLKYIFGSEFGDRRSSGKGTKAKDFIELLDASGKSFAEVYGNQKKDEKLSTEIVDMTKGVIYEAIKQNASDILIDPKGDDIYSVRYRVDGFLRTVDQVKSEKCTAVVNSIKALSAMDIAEKRRPQDGSFMAKIPQGNVHFRVASSGVLGGEKLSLRVMNQAAGLLRLDEVGFSQENYRLISDIISQPSGMVLVCGPTGSGKTTSLYAMLGAIDFYARNVVTVEDPIEFMLDCASQIEVNVKANITFANALRSILRQDPDVICVGEIRDAETAGMALQASQTGHLVLATLHSSSNLASLVRLIDLGVKPLLLASALSVVISQRLVRKLCEDCKAPAELAIEQYRALERKGIDPEAVMEAIGCRSCYNTGYKGRTAILDIMFLGEETKAVLADKELSLGDLKKKGDSSSVSNLRREGLKKVAAGLTTLEEVKRVTSNLG
jgi:type II secretory ATPase GspE/PulE/Tfp pilus assembly ATPase PilB-like protein